MKSYLSITRGFDCQRTFAITRTLIFRDVYWHKQQETTITEELHMWREYILVHYMSAEKVCRTLAEQEYHMLAEQSE